MSSLQTLPRSAEVYAAEQRAEIGAAVAAVSRLWSRVDARFDASYLLIESDLMRTLDLAQQRVTASASAYIPNVLTETRQRGADEARYALADDALVGTTGAGYPTDVMAYGSIVRAKVAVGEGVSPLQALATSGQWLTASVGTLLSDTGRTAEKVAMRARPVTGYVRMLNPPSCGRCVILAGKRTHSSVAFMRHPRCDCRNIPSAESLAGDLVVDPRAHLDALSDDELTRTLGSRANAQAYRDGADLNQMVNAYRRGGDVTTAQVFGRTVKYTTEATTKRGIYGRAARAAGGDVGRIPRLMPESIYGIATSKADELRLLRLYGWIR